MTEILGYDYDVIDHIVRFADTHDLPPVCLLALGLQESDLWPYAAGDITIGGSYGVFQIYVKAHGGPPERWQGLDGLDASMAEMGDRWQHTFAQHGGWGAVTGDLVALQQAWPPDAQGSIAWDEPMARRQVSKAVALYSLYLKRQAAPVVNSKLPDAIDALTLAAAGLDDLAARADGLVADIVNLRERAKLQAAGARAAVVKVGA